LKKTLVAGLMARFSQSGVGVLKASLQWDVARFAIIATWMNAVPM
jgi:hypothetical protein